jgi:predicted RND superfamily exporter protein
VRSADTIVAAFQVAGLGAMAAITVILAVALRRFLDTMLVLAPLLLSTLLTVIVSVSLPLPLNFANIIALPLLLGVGVSFNIYFIMNWRAGRTAPLSSATARAILFSALTTATAFGSLALSRHPGTASMGELLLVSLGCTLVATFAFVPALLASVRRS